MKSVTRMFLDEVPSSLSSSQLEHVPGSIYLSTMECYSNIIMHELYQFILGTVSPSSQKVKADVGIRWFSDCKNSSLRCRLYIEKESDPGIPSTPFYVKSADSAGRRRSTIVLCKKQFCCKIYLSTLSIRKKSRAIPVKF